MKENQSRKIYDTVIVGGGPAGYSAALYCARAGLDTVIIEKLYAGGQMSQTSSIENYPGSDIGIDGITLAMKMQEQAEHFGAVTKNEQVISLELSNKIKKAVTDSAEYLSKTVIIATGAEHKKLGLEGEEELIGRGVSYCATCDGMLFKDKTVAVVGGGNTAVADALYLSNIAKKVYIIHRRDTFRASKIYHDRIKEKDKIELILNSELTSLLYDTKLTGVEVTDKDGSTKTILTDALFVAIGNSPVTSLVSDILTLDEEGYIIAGEDTKTNIDGVFAAGDVRTKPLRQIVGAVSDGASAASFAEKYINTL